MTEERRVQLVAEVDTTRTRAGFAEIGQQAGQMAQRVTQAGEQAERAVADIGTGASTSARNVDAAQRNIISAIQRTTTAMEAGGRQTAAYYELLARQRGVDPAALTPYLNQLRALEQAQNRAGASAAQTAAALRTVPAQFTDIVTALQGGQQPLTVLLQQGGQLRDQFGSTGAAARALSGYILGLVNPYTVAAAAAIGLAVAYKAGAEEAAGYARALALTNNAAGATVEQMSEAARQVGAVTGSTRNASAAMIDLANTGQVSAENFREFGLLAVQVQRDTGRAAAETAADFAELGKSPLTALDKINEKYHFITAATYAQVKALQDQGRASEAADLAQRAYADGVERQRQKVSDSLTDWERGWIRIKDATSAAIDKAIDYASGRQQTSSQQINDLLAERAKLEENLRRAQARGLGANVAGIQAELDYNQRQINAIRDKTAAERDRAKQAETTQKQDDARKQWLKDGDKYLTRQEQLELAITKARNEGAAANLSATDIDKRVADIRKSFSDIFNAGIDSNIEALKRRDQVQDVLTQRELARISAQRDLGAISDTDAINQAAAAELAAFDRKRVLLERELELTKKKANSIKEQADIEGQIDVLSAQRKSRDVQRETELVALQERRLRATNELYLRGITGATAETESLVAAVDAQFQYNQEIGLSKAQLADLRAARLENSASLKDEAAAALEAIEPNSKLAEEYRRQAQSMRDLGDAMIRGADKEQRVDQWRQSVEQYGSVFRQGFADMLNDGKAGWDSFTKSLVTTFKTSVADQIFNMFVRPIEVQLVGSFLGVSQTAIAGEIARQPNAYGVSKDSSSPVGAAQVASSLYSTFKTGGTFEQSITNGVQGLLDKAGLSIGSGAPSQFAQWAGRAGGTVAGYMVGSTLNSAISGQYQTGSGVMTAEKIATAVASYVAGPIGGAVAGAVSGLFNRAFGMGATTIKKQGMQGTLSADSLTGLKYFDMHQDGGWFRSPRNWQTTEQFTSDTVKQFTQGLAAIESASSGFASALGVQADWIKDYSKVFDITLSGDATKDQKAIEDFFTGIGNEIATKLVPSLDQFSKSGEAAAATLERLAGDFQGTDRVAQLLGVSSDALFGASGMQSATAREQLIDLAGGLSVLGQQASFFNQNFLTEAERIAPVAKALDKALASLGLTTIPKTRAEFAGLVRNLIQSGAAATATGAKQLDSLLALGEAFAQVHPDDAADAARVLQQRQQLMDELDQLTLSSAAGLQKQRDALDESNRALFDQVLAVKAQQAAIEATKARATTLLSGVDSAYGVLQKVVTREKTALQSNIDTHTAAANKLRTLSQALRSTLDSMRGPDQQLADRRNAQAQIRTALAIARAGGPLPDADGLKKALSAVQQDAADQFSTYNDYLRDFYQTQADIADLASITDDSLSIEEKSLDALNKQLDGLDGILASAQEQIDVLKGQSTTLLSIDQAINGLAVSLQAARGNSVVAATSAIASAYQNALGRPVDQSGLEFWQQQAASGTSTSDIVNAITTSAEARLQGMYQATLGRPGDAAGMQFWMQQLASGTSYSAVQDALTSSDEYRRLHPFAVGTNYVPETVSAPVPEVEPIIASANGRALMARLASPSSGANDTQVLVTEIRQLRETVEQQQRALNRIAESTGRHVELFDTATAGGGPLLVEMA